MATRQRPRLNDDRGVTLIELLVAISLFGVLLTIVAGLYVSSLQTVSLSRELTGNTKVASTAMNETSRVIRAGTSNPQIPPALAMPAFVLAQKDDVVLYAYINLESSEERPQMIRLRVDRTTGKYIESRWPATQTVDKRWVFPTNPCRSTNSPTGCSPPTSTWTIAETIAPQGSRPNMFRYFDNSGAELNLVGGELNEEARGKVASVKVTLTVQPSLTDDSNPVTLENSVGIPNLGFAKGTTAP